MGWLNFAGKKRSAAQGFGNSPKRKGRQKSRSHVLERIVTPSAGVAGWLDDLNPLHQLFGSLSLPDLHLPNFFADSGVCPIDPSGAPTNNLPPLIDFDPLGLYHDGIATQTPYNPGGAFETLPVAVIPVDPYSPNPNNPNAIRQLLDSPFASQPYVGTIDTGVSADSPYLNYANIKKGRDYVGGDDNPLLKAGEGSEHGTFMLGIIDAINKTAPKWVGRAIDSGKWANSLVDFVDAAKASGQKNAIANLSLDLTQKNPDGSVTTRYELTPAERKALEYARQNGVMLVVAAGNDGGVMSVLGQASQEFDNIFTVGAGDINGRSIYSSYGRGLDILADGGTTEHPDLSTVGNDLGTMAGTSVATAKVAGAASLVWAANPALNYRQVMEILKSTARDLGPSGWDDETGFGFLNTLAAVDLAKKTMPEVYNPTPWVTPETWSGEGIVTPEERAAKGGNSIAAATVQVSTNFSDIDRVDANQPDKYYQFRVNEPGYVRWNLTSLNPVSGFPSPPNVTIIKADGSSASHRFHKGGSVSMSVTTEGQTSFSGGDFYDPGTYYLKVGGVGSTLKDYNISTQFSADRVASFAGNIQYRTQPYKSFDDSQTAVFSGPTVSELKNLSGQVTYNNTDFNSGVAKYGFEVNESGKFRINLNSPNGKMDLNINKFIGSEDRPVQIGGFGGVPANSDGWVEVDLNKGRYEIEVKTPTDYWQFDGKSAQQTLVRPYTLNGIFTPNAPQPGQGKVPSSAGAFDKTVVSNGVVNHYYANGYLTVQPSGQASWYSYGGGGVTKVTVVPIPDKLPQDYAGNLPNTARNIGNLIGTKTFQDVIDKNDRFDYYKFDLTTDSKVDFALSGKMGNTGFYLFKDWKINSDTSTHIDILSGTTPGVVPEFSETLKAGTYYVLVHKPEGYDGGEYDLKLSAIPLGDPDGNYSIPTSQVIFASADLGDGIDHKAVGSSIGGNLDREDYYRFTLDKISDVDIQLSGDNPKAKFYLAKDVNGNGKIDYGEGLQWANQDANTKKISRSLSPGTYYVVVNSDDRVNQTKYNLNVDTKPETAGNSPSAAQDIGVLNGSKTFQGLVDTKADVYDYYRFKLDEPGNVSLTLDKLIATSSSDSQGITPIVSMELMSANNQILASGRGDSSSAASINGFLQPGYYYVRVNSTDTTGYASYELTLNGEPAYKKAIDAEYAGHQGLLGNPTTGYWPAADSPNGTKGYGQNYNNGTVFWTAKSGAIALWHGFANTYNQTGGSNGWLGFPTKGKETDSSGGQRIDFEGGYIYWDGQQAKAYHPWETPQQNLNNTVGYDGANTHPTYVNTFTRNGGSSALGSATGNVHRSVDNGYVQEFSGGSEGSGAIMKSGANDNSFWVGSFFWNAYVQTGGVTGFLGYPISNRYEFNGGWRQDFQGGSLSTTLPLTPAPNSGTNTSPQAPQILSRLIESGTGKLITATNFRSSPWADPSNSNLMQQGISAGTTFTLLENVTTNDPTYLNWYRVRLNNGDVGYFWANNVEKLASSSGDSKPIIDFGSGGNSSNVKFTFLSSSNSSSSTPPQIIELGNVYNYDNYPSSTVIPGGKIGVSGKFNDFQGANFYLNDIKLGGNLSQSIGSDGSVEFTALLNVPLSMSGGTYKLRAELGNAQGVQQSEASNYITVLPNGKANPFAFYPELEIHKTDDNWWDLQTGDSFLYDKQKKPSEFPSHQKLKDVEPSQEVHTIYQKLSESLFQGKVIKSESGYVYDEVYIKTAQLLPDQRYGWIHPGIDISASTTDDIYSPVDGIVVQDIPDLLGSGRAIAVQEKVDGKPVNRFWWYLHLAKNTSIETDVHAKTTTIGHPGDYRPNLPIHLHLTVTTVSPDPKNPAKAALDVNKNDQPGTTDQQKEDAAINQVIGVTMSPLQAFWEAMNGIPR